MYKIIPFHVTLAKACHGYTWIYLLARGILRLFRAEDYFRRLCRGCDLSWVHEVLVLAVLRILVIDFVNQHLSEYTNF